MQITEAPIEMERKFNVDIATLWGSLTDPEQMRQWFFVEINDFKPEVGFESQFSVHAEEREFPHRWKVTEVVPQQKIAYTWRYEGFPGDSLAVWELAEASDGTTLNFMHKVLASFPKGDAIFSRENCQAGWEFFLDDRLKSYLETASG